MNDFSYPSGITPTKELDSESENNHSKGSEEDDFVRSKSTPNLIIIEDGMNL